VWILFKKYVLISFITSNEHIFPTFKNIFLKISNVNIILISVLIIFFEKKAKTFLNLNNLYSEHQKRQINCVLLTFNFFDSVFVFDA
jgi:hypothetical protein